jgi:1,2-phenylacetyl-CoA epoxidase PaaB subunit
MALDRLTHTEHYPEQMGGNLPRSTSVSRLAAFRCACSVEDAGLRRALLTQNGDFDEREVGCSIWFKRHAEQRSGRNR